jgi:hypothetical protein
MTTTQTGVDQYRTGGFAHDAAQNVAADATQLIEVVEGLPARLNPDAAGYAAAVTAFWNGVGALATANGYVP